MSGDPNWWRGYRGTVAIAPYKGESFSFGTMPAEDIPSRPALSLLLTDEGDTIEQATEALRAKIDLLLDYIPPDKLLIRNFGTKDAVDFETDKPFREATVRLAILPKDPL